MLEQNLNSVVDALHKELNRHAFETITMEVRGIKGDVVDMLEHIDEWSKGEKPDAGFIFGTLGKAWLRKEPLGVTFIIAAWNFPLYTLLSPMVAAIAAGKSPKLSSRPTVCTLQIPYPVSALVEPSRFGLRSQIRQLYLTEAFGARSCHSGAPLRPGSQILGPVGHSPRNWRALGSRPYARD